MFSLKHPFSLSDLRFPIDQELQCKPGVAHVAWQCLKPRQLSLLVCHHWPVVDWEMLGVLGTVLFSCILYINKAGSFQVFSFFWKCQSYSL